MIAYLPTPAPLLQNEFTTVHLYEVGDSWKWVGSYKVPNMSIEEYLKLEKWLRDFKSEKIMTLQDVMKLYKEETK